MTLSKRSSKSRNITPRGRQSANEFDLKLWITRFVYIAGVLAALMGGAKAWDYFEFFVPASRQWVIEAQYPILQQGQKLQIGQLRGRISAIKDLLVSLDDKKLKVFGGERTKIELQIRDLNKEWTDIEAEIKGIETVRK